ncbi:transglycosylase SLT domain-containing protein [Streptomyces sp. SID724]|uniref:transglycosylase SLT domain-containing protein n=1 Tax=Streptomyces sp. SID724 TaxID=2690324 RepID=UPI001361BB36|nr:transglycosylase SLT domain-containing protein [Streptomyces sp. SID724]
MAKLTQAQVAMYAQSAGMPNPVLMSAIAMAESGGNTHAHNPLGLDNSYGLWQINMLGDMGPARRREFGITSNSQLFDPAVNARAAAKILSQQGLAAWSVYTNGSYKRYMPSGASTSLVNWDPLEDFWNDLLGPPKRGPGTEDFERGRERFDPGTGQAVDDLSELATGVKGVAEGVVKAGTWMGNSKNWVRVAYVVGGGVLAGIGLYIVAAPLIGKAAAATPGASAIKAAVGGGKKKGKK